MRRLRRLCVVPTAALTLAAMGTGSITSTAAAASAPLTISMFGGLPITVTNVSTNSFTSYLDKKFDVNLTFNLVADSDVATKQPLLMASGGYPNVIWDGWLRPTDALQYGQEGLLIPLNKLIRQYAPNIWHLIQTNSSYRQAVTAPNGSIYTLANYNACYHCYWPFQYYINIKLLQKYNLAIPRTTAQFVHVLEVFKQHGIVPLTGNSATAPGSYNNDIITFLMNSFIPYNGPVNGIINGLAEVNGHLVYDPITPQWKEGLEYIHSLYTKGLFSNVALTQQVAPVERLIENQDVGVVPSGGINADFLSNDLSDQNDWFAMTPLVGPDGVQSAAYGSAVEYPNVFAITNKASSAQQIKMMQILNYVSSDLGTEVDDFGVEGKYWTPAAKGLKGFAGTQAQYNSNWTTVDGFAEQNVEWDDWGGGQQSATWWNGQVMTPPFLSNGLGSQAYLYLTSEIAMAGHEPAEQYPSVAWVPQNEAETYATQQTNIGDYVTQETDQFITGQLSISGGWNSYVAGVKNLALAQFLATSARAAKPVQVDAPALKPSASDIKYMLSSGPVPSVVKTYLLELGLPHSDFSSNS